MKSLVLLPLSLAGAPRAAVAPLASPAAVAAAPIAPMAAPAPLTAPEAASALAQADALSAPEAASAFGAMADGANALESDVLPAELAPYYGPAAHGGLIKLQEDPVAAALRASGARVWSVRHGQSEANRAKLFAGRTDVPLTVVPDADGVSGVAQAAAAAAKLYAELGGERWARDVASGKRRPLIVLTSPLKRARQTAEALGSFLDAEGRRLGAQSALYESRVEPLLIEMDYGRLDNRPYSEVLRTLDWKYWDGISGEGRSFRGRFPEGESRVSVLRRQRQVLAGIAAKLAGRDVITFAHFEVLTAQMAIMGALATAPDGAMRVTNVPNASPLRLVP